MLRPIKSLTALLVGCLFLFTFILISTTSTSQHSYYTPRRPSSLRKTIVNGNNIESCGSSSPAPPAAAPIENNFERQQQQRVQVPGRPVPTKVTRQVKPSAIPVESPVVQKNYGDNIHHSTPQEGAEGERYLMYIPYAGVTNQLISIWHGSLIAKALNRTLLIPNISPNVHVEPSSSSSSSGEQQQEPALTKWSEFFDLEEYSARTGLKIEELDRFLERRGIVEQSSAPAVEAIRQLKEEVSNGMRKRNLSKKKRSPSEVNKKKTRRSHDDDKTEPGTGAGSATESIAAGTDQKKSSRRRNHRKRWIQFESLVQQSSPVASSPSSSTAATGSQDPESNQHHTSINSKTTRTTIRPIRFPAVQQCFSEAGYGADRRIDMTGRRFMQRYNINSTLIPTPFLDPLRDNGSIWSRWRMDKVIERYQQPQYAQEEILCLGHVYRLLPGGNNRVWTEFGQYFRYTERVQDFVDEILKELLPKDEQAQDQDHEQDSSVQTRKAQQPFVGLHLRRGDFYRHCLGITSPADPNGWNRCYPSTEHIISLLDSTPTASISTTITSPPNNPNNKKKLPVLVLTNEHDPKELAKADAQNWIRVDHGRLRTLDRFGRYGPILIDGALLARASLLVGVEYSTYFKTASKRAETWHGGQTLFVT
ncbi:hypothetical protein BGX29_011966 [Mortierella sp. GBA35]|nr:hypothetical protein BGX29_011966 [Mortierella sp. GBA35]